MTSYRGCWRSLANAPPRGALGIDVAMPRADQADWVSYLPTFWLFLRETASLKPITYPSGSEK